MPIAYRYMAGLVQGDNTRCVQKVYKRVINIVSLSSTIHRMFLLHLLVPRYALALRSVNH